MSPPRDFKIGPTQVGMIAAQTIFGCDPNYDSSRPFPPAAPGVEQIELLDGTTSFVGYARAVWTLVDVIVARLVAGRQFALGSTTAYSGQCYVRTLDADGAYKSYRAIARFPNPMTLERDGAIYKNVQINFILLEVV